MERLQWDNDDGQVRLYAVKDGDVALTIARWKIGTPGEMELHTPFRLSQDRSISPALGCRLFPEGCWSHADMSGAASAYLWALGDPDHPAEPFWTMLESVLHVRGAQARADRLPAGEEMVECPLCHGDGMVEARKVVAS